jgi:pimeloyl-ACP methyl ester carboxylesterase
MAAAVILIPGLVCDAAVWHHAAAALRADADVHVAHHGLLDSLGAMAEKILDEHAGPLRVAGHSMGGRVALEILRRAPGRVAGIALLDTGTAPLASGDPGARERAGRHELLEIARTQGMAAMAGRWVQGMVWQPRLADAALIDSVIAMFRRSCADAFAAQIRALLARPDATALLDTIRCPALVLCGSEDSWAPADRHRDMAARIKGAVLTLVPECGHMSPMERPAAVTAALVEWAARCAQRPH